MRFQELQIETRREMPARARTDGERYLIRAGYLRAHGQLTALGNQAISRLRRLLGEPPTLLESLGLPVFTTADGEVVADIPAGDYRLFRCPQCGYAASSEMTQARKLPHAAEPPLPLERVATPECSTIEALSGFLGVPQTRTAKTLLYTRLGDGELVFVLIRGDMQLSEGKLHAAAGPVRPAVHDEILAAGAVPGYASPIGLRSAFVLVDELVPDSSNLVAGANELGFHLLNSNYGRDYEADRICDLTLAHPGDPCSVCGSPLVARAGILLADRTGTAFFSILLSLAEQYHDDRGLRFPLGASPFDVHVLHLPSRELDTKSSAEAIHLGLEAAGVAALFDDREERAGVKFNDADLLGFPLRLTVGERNLRDRMVELKRRSDASTELIPIEEIVDRLRSLTVMPR